MKDQPLWGQALVDLIFEREVQKALLDRFAIGPPLAEEQEPPYEWPERAYL